MANLERGHYKLTPELIAKAQELAASGTSYKTIADICGIAYSTFHYWVDNAKKGIGTELETELLEALHQGAAAGELTLLQALHDQRKNDPRAAQWLLSRSPRWRETWSDAAATRKVLTEQAGKMAQIILDHPGLDSEMQRDLLLRMQAQGLSTPAAPDAG